MSLGIYYFIDIGYARIAAMQLMETVWKKKAPLINIHPMKNRVCKLQVRNILMKMEMYFI